MGREFVTIETIGNGGPYEHCPLIHGIFQLLEEKTPMTKGRRIRMEENIV